MEFSDVSKICEDSFVARRWGEELYIQDNIHIMYQLLTVIQVLVVYGSRQISINFNLFKTIFPRTYARR